MGPRPPSCPQEVALELDGHPEMVRVLLMRGPCTWGHAARPSEAREAGEVGVADIPTCQGAGHPSEHSPPSLAQQPSDVRTPAGRGPRCQGRARLLCFCRRNLSFSPLFFFFFLSFHVTVGFPSILSVQGLSLPTHDCLEPATTVKSVTTEALARRSSHLDRCVSCAGNVLRVSVF